MIMAWNRVRYRLRSLAKLLFHLASIAVTRIILLLLVRLHKIGESTTTSLVQHLLTVLRILTHHLVLLLVVFLLLKFVVEGLELMVLRRVRVTMSRVCMRAMTTVALWASKHIIDVLTQTDFRTESIHQVRRCVLIAVTGHISHTDIAATCTSLSLALILREFVEIRCLLHHVRWHHLLSVRWVSTSCIAHRVSLKFVQTTGDALYLSW